MQASRFRPWVHGGKARYLLMCTACEREVMYKWYLPPAGWSVRGNVRGDIRTGLCPDCGGGDDRDQ